METLYLHVIEKSKLVAYPSGIRIVLFIVGARTLVMRLLWWFGIVREIKLVLSETDY